MSANTMLFVLIISFINVFTYDFDDSIIDADDLLSDTNYNTDVSDFDNNFIIDSDEREAFSEMSPEDCKLKFNEIITKMDSNGDDVISITELQDWIKIMYYKALYIDVEFRWQKYATSDEKHIKLDKYWQKTFGDEIKTADKEAIAYDKKRWEAADLDKDNLLNKTEFFRFMYPFEFEDMKPIAAEEILKLMDLNKDSVLDLKEYINEMSSDGKDVNETWIEEQKQTFANVRDINKDGVIDKNEVQNWLIPENSSVIFEESERLMTLADLNKDNILTRLEMLDNYQNFVGKKKLKDADSSKANHEEL